MIIHITAITVCDDYDGSVAQMACTSAKTKFPSLNILSINLKIWHEEIDGNVLALYSLGDSRVIEKTDRDGKWRHKVMGEIIM